jgi:hypothetical protein
MTKSPIFRFILILITVAAFVAISPAEKIMGGSARVVYLHGVWVWVALAAMLAVWQCARWWLQLECPVERYNHNDRIASTPTSISP